MKTIKVQQVVLILALSMFFLLVNTGQAQAANVSAPSSVTVGDNVSVSVSISGTGLTSMFASYTLSGAVTDTGSFDAHCADADFISGVGASSLSGSFSFKPSATGTINVSVTVRYIDVNNNESSSSGSATITVNAQGSGGGGGSTPKPTTTPKPSTTPRPTATPTPEVPVKDREIPAEIGGTELFIWQKIPETVELPGNFEIMTIKYEDKDIEAAVHKDRDLTLLYTTDEDGAEDAFYVYIEDDEKPLFFPFIPLASSSDFIIFPIPDELELPGMNYIETTIKLGGVDVACWQDPDGEPYMYLLYLSYMDSTPGFYLYDSEQGTIQRYSVRTVEVEVTPEPILIEMPEPEPPQEEVTEPPTPEPVYAEPQRELNAGLLITIVTGAVLVVMIISALVIKTKMG